MSNKAYELKFYGTEPEWTSIDLADSEKVEEAFSSAVRWYNYMADDDERRRWLLEYLKAKNYTKEQIQAIGQLPRVTIRYGDIPGVLGFDTGMYARLVSLGAPVPEAHLKSLDRAITHLLSRTLPKTEVVPSGVNIQQAIADNARHIIGNIESMFDRIATPKMAESGFSSQNLENFKEGKATATKSITEATVAIKTLLQSVKSIYCSKIINHYEPVLEELKQAISGSDPALQEAYSIYKPKILTLQKDFIENLLHECAAKIAFDKSSKPVRRKRQKAPADLVKKMTYCKESSELGLKSVGATKIIGAGKLVVFNTKTRVLSFFESESAHGLSVKGASIIGYDVKKSVGKKLRKPAKFFATINGKGWRAFKSEFEKIKSVEKASKPRINQDVVLYGVY